MHCAIKGCQTEIKSFFVLYLPRMFLISPQNDRYTCADVDVMILKQCHYGSNLKTKSSGPLPGCRDGHVDEVGALAGLDHARCLPNHNVLPSRWLILMSWGPFSDKAGHVIFATSHIAPPSTRVYIRFIFKHGYMENKICTTIPPFNPSELSQPPKITCRTGLLLGQKFCWPHFRRFRISKRRRERNEIFISHKRLFSSHSQVLLAMARG
jgi:hypothetical protein